MKVRDLDWRGYGATLDAAAFGIDTFYRVEGEPGNWALISPGPREYLRTPGYKSQVAAKAAAQVDFDRRVRREADDNNPATRTADAQAAVRRQPDAAKAEGRREGLEEAARRCEAMVDEGQDDAFDCAVAIRGMIAAEIDRLDRAGSTRINTEGRQDSPGRIPDCD